MAAAEAELEEGETLPESGKAQAEAALARLQNGEDMITIIKEMEAEQEQDSEEETTDGEETAEEETDPSEYDNVVSVNNTSVPEVYGPRAMPWQWARSRSSRATTTTMW